MFGHIFDIKKFAIHDGPGIRTTIFLKGCPLRCWWCHNPESIKQIPDNNSAYCEEELSGATRRYSVADIMDIIKKDQIFYDQSSGGVTFSGGEPLIQIGFLEKVLSICKKEYISTTVDTCGYVSTDSFKKIYDNVDLFLYDIKINDDVSHKKYTGVSNKLIKQNLEFLHSVNAQVIIRIPLIPEITDTTENLSEIANFLLQFDNIKKIDLLPYNKLAEDKYRRLNVESKLGNIDTQSPEQLKRIKTLVESFGLKTELNG